VVRRNFEAAVTADNTAGGEVRQDRYVGRKPANK
jgi:hypothetical protein